VWHAFLDQKPHLRLRCEVDDNHYTPAMQVSRQHFGNHSAAVGNFLVGNVHLLGHRQHSCEVRTSHTASTVSLSSQTAFTPRERFSESAVILRVMEWIRQMPIAVVHPFRHDDRRFSGSRSNSMRSKSAGAPMAVGAMANDLIDLRDRESKWRGGCDTNLTLP
jgi:hypothetical protein